MQFIVNSNVPLYLFELANANFSQTKNAAIILVLAI